MMNAVYSFFFSSPFFVLPFLHLRLSRPLGALFFLVLTVVSSQRTPRDRFCAGPLPLLRLLRFFVFPSFVRFDVGGGLHCFDCP